MGIFGNLAAAVQQAGHQVGHAPQVAAKPTAQPQQHNYLGRSQPQGGLANAKGQSGNANAGAGAGAGLHGSFVAGSAPKGTPWLKPAVQAADVAVHQPAVKNYIAQALSNQTVGHAPANPGAAQLMQSAFKAVDNNQPVSTRLGGIKKLVGSGALNVGAGLHGSFAAGKPQGKSLIDTALESVERQTPLGGVLGLVDHAGPKTQKALSDAQRWESGAVDDVAAELGRAAGHMAHDTGLEALGSAALNTLHKPLNNAPYPAPSAADIAHTVSKNVIRPAGSYLGHQMDTTAQEAQQEGFPWAVPLSNKIQGDVKALYNEPGPTLQHTVQGAKNMALGLFPSAVQIGHAATQLARGHPEEMHQVIHYLAKDYTDRYGGSPDQIAHYAETHGIAEDLADAAGARALVRGSLGRLNTFAKSGGFGGEPNQFYTEPRPRMQNSGGTGASSSRPQGQPIGITQTWRNRLTDAFRAAAQDARNARNPTKKTPIQGEQSNVNLPPRPTGPISGRVFTVTRQYLNAMKEGQQPESVTRLSGAARNNAARKTAVVNLGEGQAAWKNISYRYIDKQYEPLTKSLNKNEQAVFNLVHRAGIHANAETHFDEIQARLQQMHDEIVQNRAEPGADIHGDHDWLPIIDKLKDNPDLIRKSFTPHLQEVQRKAHALDVEIANNAPNILPGHTAEYRRNASVANRLGIVQGERAAEAAPAEQVSAVEGQLAHEQQAQAARTADYQGVANRVDAARNLAERPGTEGEGAAAQAALQRLMAKLNEIASDRASGAQRVSELQRQLLQMRVPRMTHFDETPREFFDRLYAELDRQGLPRPGYIPGDIHEVAGNLEHTLGATRAAKQPFKWQGKLEAVGRDPMHPRTAVLGALRTLRAPMKDLTLNTFLDAHAPEGLRELPLDQLQHNIQRGGYDPNQLTLIHHGTFLQGDRADLGIVPERSGDHELPAGQETAALAESNERPMANAERESPFADTGTAIMHYKDALKWAQQNPESAARGGWSAVPRAAGDEFKASTSPRVMTTVTRGLGKLKSFQTRAVLTTPSYFENQAFGQMMALGGATAGRGFRYLGQGTKWLDNMTTDLTPTAKAQVQAMVGYHADIGRLAGNPDASKVYLGAQTPRMMNAIRQNLADATEGFYHRNPVGKALLTVGNPMTFFLRGDLIMKRDVKMAYLRDKMEYPRPEQTEYLNFIEQHPAYQALNQSLPRLAASHQRLLPFLKAKVPEDIQRAAFEDPHVMREFAQHTADALGDFTSFGSKERAGLLHNVMFYGYLRYSLRLMFHTLPVKHPLATMVLAHLGNLNQQEIEHLIGSNDQQAMEATGGVGAFRFGPGDAWAIEMIRGNPTLNPVVDSALGVDQLGQPTRDAAHDVSGFIPPLFQQFYLQLTGRNMYMNDQKAGLNGQRDSRYQPLAQPTIGDRGWMFLASVARLFGAYNYAEEAWSPESRAQADSVLLFHNRPYEPSTVNSVTSQLVRQQEHAALGSPGEQFLRSFFMPFLPKKDSYVARAQRLLNYGKPPDPWAAWQKGGTNDTYSLQWKAQQIADQRKAAQSNPWAQWQSAGKVKAP